MRALLALVLSFVFLLSSALQLAVTNVDVLEQARVGELLQLNLTVISSESASASFLHPDSGSKICFLVDARRCHCFDEPLSASSLLPLPAACSKREGAYWFSVQLLRGEASDSFVTSTAVRIGGLDKQQQQLLTLVLPLTLDDVSRSLVLLSTLQQIPAQVVHELLVFVPDGHQPLVYTAMSGFAQACTFPIRVIAESTLFGSSFSLPANVFVYSYAVQMAVKLLAARLVATEFYLTLDADLVLLQPLRLPELFLSSCYSSNTCVWTYGTTKAIYQDEDRSVHTEWWQGSARLLRFSAPIQLQAGASASGSGFGVTPSVLNTFGSLWTVERIGMSELEWLLSFGEHVWSEYTLYRLALDESFLFEELHEAEKLDVGARLHCFDVWFSAQLPWPAQEAYASGCLFSVLQSTSGISPSLVLKQIKQR